MKKLILGILLMAFMPLVLAQVVTYPANFEKSLLMSDLENLDLSGLTVQQTDANFFVFEVHTYPTYQTDGSNYFPSNKTKLGINWISPEGIQGFVDEDVSEELPVTLRFLDDGVNVDLRDGDYITLTYDGGKIKRVYLPPIQGHMPFHLYVAKDGSTYYDPEFTDLAKQAPEKKYYMPGEVVELYYLTTEEYSDLDYHDGHLKYVYCSYEFDSPNEETCGTVEQLFEGNCDYRGLIPMTEGYKCETYGPEQEPYQVELIEGKSAWKLVIASVEVNYDEESELWISEEPVILESHTQTYRTITEPDANFMQILIQTLIRLICKIFPFGFCSA